MDALSNLSGVRNAKSIALEAIAKLDRHFLDQHPNAGKLLHERIRLALAATEGKQRAAD